MNEYVNKEYVESSLEYELNHLGVSSKAVAEMKARLVVLNGQQGFTIPDEQWMGPDKMDLSVHVGPCSDGDLQVTNYDVSFKGIHFTFDREGLFWPTLKQAKNLLEGSPVGRAIISPVEGNAVVEWFRLDKDWQRVTDHYRLESLGFFDLQWELKLLPIREKHDPDGLLAIYSDLLNGDKPAVYYTDMTEMEANVEVNAITQCVEVRNKDGQVLANTTAMAIAEQLISNGTNLSIYLNNPVMKNKNYSESNYEYNIGRLRQHGIPDTQNEWIKEQMKAGVSRILPEYHSAEYAGTVKVIAHIEKADSGAYWPNRYEEELKRPDSKYPRRQYFQIQNFKGHGNQYDIPWKMGMNLLKGGQVLNHWLMDDKSTVYEWRGLNFSDRTNAGYGYVSFDASAFDVAQRLGELPILEKDKNDLRYSHVIRSIEMGNSQVVHLDTPDNLVIRVRANVPKRELDIIKGGHVISLDQLKAELSEWRTQGVYIGDAPWEQGTPSHEKSNTAVASQPETSRQSGESPDNTVEKGELPTLLEAGKQMGNVMIVGIGGAQTSDKAMKVLTGNPITPNPGGHKGKTMSHGR